MRNEPIRYKMPFATDLWPKFLTKSYLRELIIDYCRDIFDYLGPGLSEWETFRLHLRPVIDEILLAVRALDTTSCAAIYSPKVIDLANKRGVRLMLQGDYQELLGEGGDNVLHRLGLKICGLLDIDLEDLDCAVSEDTYTFLTEKLYLCWLLNYVFSHYNQVLELWLETNDT